MLRRGAWGIFTAGLLLWAAPAVAQRPVWVLYDSSRVHATSLQKQLARAGANVRYSSRWLNAISVDADAKSIAKVKKLRGVTGTQPVRQLEAKSPPRSTSPHHPRPQADFDSTFYGFNWRAIKQLGVAPAHILGFTGLGIRIAIIDTGFEPAHEALATRIVTAQRDFIQNDNNVANQTGERTDSLDQEVHGTRVWSLIGGYKPGLLVGPAFDASFILAKVDVVQVGIEDFAADEDRWVRAVEWADSMGARIINSSVGFREFVDRADYQESDLDGDGGTGVNLVISTRMADEAARRGILVVNAMGAAPALLTSMQAPADADSIISVGAIDTVGNPAVFRNGLTTARGPTADGRIKPDVVAPGTHLFAARSANPIGYDAEVEGTSMATAFISGGAAQFMQAWPDLSVGAVIRALRLSGSRSEAPDNIFGYGVPDIASAIFLPEGLEPGGIEVRDAQNRLTTLQPRFNWIVPLRHRSMIPLYRLEIATDPAFANIVYSDTVRDRTSITVNRPLQPSPQYFWRVIAETSPNIRRVTRPAAPFIMPDWVRLLTLNEPGAFTTTTTPTFRWEPLTAPAPIGPLTYDLQIINNQTGAIVQTIPNLTTATVEPTIPLIANLSYRWRVIVKSRIPGAVDTVSSAHAFVVSTNEDPPATLLYQNFPNPFPRPDLGVSETQFWFDVTTSTKVELAIYDLRGRKVRSLIPANASCGVVTLEPGQYGRGATDTDPCVRTRWDARTDSGELVTRGVYILRLRAGGADQIKRILYMP